MLTDDPTPPAAAPTPAGRTPALAGGMRPIACCVVRARRPAPALTNHLRAAAVWAALLRAPDQEEQADSAADDQRDSDHA